MNRDYTDGDIRKMFDDFHSHDPQRAVGNMARARPEMPGLSPLGQKRLVLANLGAKDPVFFRALLNGRSRRGPESTQTSPLEQIKGRTSLLDPTGELTGGNYGPRF